MKLKGLRIPEFRCPILTWAGGDSPSPWLFSPWEQWGPVLPVCWEVISLPQSTRSIVKQTIANWTLSAHVPKQYSPPCQISILLPKVSWKKVALLPQLRISTALSLYPTTCYFSHILPSASRAESGRIVKLKAQQSAASCAACSFNVWAERGSSLLMRETPRDFIVWARASEQGCWWRMAEQGPAQKLLAPTRA